MTADVDTSSSDRPAPGTSPVRLGHAVASGLVAVGVVLGVGMLTTSVLGRAFPGTTLPVWWPVAIFSGESVAGTVVTALGLGIVGIAAGLLGRLRQIVGVAVLAVAGGLLVWLVSPWEPGYADWLVPAVGTLVGCIVLSFLLRPVRPRPRPLDTEPSEPEPDRGGVPRRRALVTGFLVAGGTAALGLLTRSTAVAAAGDPAPPPAPTGEASLAREPVVDVVRDFGAVGDGRADDRAALTAALRSVEDTGGTVYLPRGTYRIGRGPALEPGSNVTLAGEPGRSTIDFVDGGPGFSTGLQIVGAGIVIDGIILRRSGSFDCVLILCGAFRDFTLSRTTLVGNMDRYPDAICHGLRLGDTEESHVLRLSDCVVTTTVYGLLQPNDSTAETTDITVERCSFYLNRNTALEFNSPSGATRQVEVRDCYFSGTESPEGFGVGLAKVDRAVLEGNTFVGYALEGVHVEDYSEGVVVRGNAFSECGLLDHSHVQIISRTADVLVTENTFDASMNTRRMFVVNALEGGDFPTAGGRAPGPPSAVRVETNRFTCAGPVVPVLFEGMVGGRITDNVIDAPVIGGPGEAFTLYSDQGTVICGNTINGTRY